MENEKIYTSIEDKINDMINNGERDMITLLWAITGIININESFGAMPAIEDIIKDIQSTHTKYPQNDRMCKQVLLESMHATLDKWKKSHKIW